MGLPQNRISPAIQGAMKNQPQCLRARAFLARQNIQHGIGADSALIVGAAGRECEYGTTFGSNIDPSVGNDGCTAGQVHGI